MSMQKNEFILLYSVFLSPDLKYVTVNKKTVENLL